MSGIFNPHSLITFGINVNWKKLSRRHLHPDQDYHFISCGFSGCNRVNLYETGDLY